MAATESRAISRGFVGGRAIIEKRTIHVHDLDAERETEYPEIRPIHGNRTALAVPLLREGTPIGVINVRRTEVRPFTDKQIKLLETFADQAVIAIENVRLFKELQERNRDLTEAWSSRRRRAKFCGVIASSPTDIQPVLDVVAENAARLCDANDAQIRRVDGDVLRAGGVTWIDAALPMSRPMSRELVRRPALVDRQTIHIHDIQRQKLDGISRDVRELAPRESGRSSLAAASRRDCDRRDHDPPRRRSAVYRQTDRAPRNLRRPSRDRYRERAAVQGTQERNAELREALEHQTATAEVLGIISRSPTDVQPVSTPSSRARRGFVGSMTWCCDSMRITLWFRGLILVPYPLAASRSVLMSHSFAGCASMARSIFPTSAPRMIFQRWFRRRVSHLLGRSPSPAGGTHWSAERTSLRGAPLHPGADQAA